MARLRNSYLECIEFSDIWSEDYVLMIDSDEIGSELWSEQSILSSFQHDNWQMMCPIQPKGYYDLYALRTLDDFLNYDCWERYATETDSSLSYKHTRESWAKHCAFVLRKHVLSKFNTYDKIEPGNAPVRVESAFGGAAWLNMAKIDKLPLHSHFISTCEWVSFCKQLDGVYINPGFVNFTGMSEHILANLDTYSRLIGGFNG